MLTRLQEYQIKLVVVRQVYYAESLRDIVTQHSAGLVSRHIQRDILRKRSKHLWTN
uniref:Uncharacterized protein n=1 Tax=Arion vulgaris TaxID=1028688 RepID=A0A0B7BNB6_9EUPU